MRPCLLDDLLAGAGRLASVPPPLRPDLAHRLLHEAHAAHHFMRRFGVPHPRWGNGSLMARALGDAAPTGRPLCLQALAVMGLAVAAFRQDAANRRHGLSPDIRLCYSQAELGDDHGRNQSKTDSGRSGLVARLR
jgi:succinate dehydrogenase/fumarate reductase flavoprotein subunit